jgi:hypothetical protein
MNELSNAPVPSLTLEEKLRLKLTEKPIFKNFQDVPKDIPTQANTGEGIQRSDIQTQVDQKPSQKKIFKIKKYVKYNKYLAEICSDEELSESEKKQLKDPKCRKILSYSKVNFSKLKAEEKDERLKNLAKLVKRLRRKVRNLEHKVRFNATKLLNKYLYSKLGINTKNKYLQPEFQFDFDKICIALKRIRNHPGFEYDDQKHLLENLISLLAEDKLKLDSLAYKRICSILRLLLKKEKIKNISKYGNKSTVQFPEQEVFISNQEYKSLEKFKGDTEALRAILCVYEKGWEDGKNVIVVPKNEEKESEKIPSFNSCKDSSSEVIKQNELAQNLPNNQTNSDIMQMKIWLMNNMSNNNLTSNLNPNVNNHFNMSNNNNNLFPQANHNNSAQNNSNHLQDFIIRNFPQKMQNSNYSVPQPQQSCNYNNPMQQINNLMTAMYYQQNQNVNNSNQLVSQFNYNNPNNMNQNPNMNNLFQDSSKQNTNFNQNMFLK